MAMFAIGLTVQAARPAGQEAQDKKPETASVAGQWNLAFDGPQGSMMVGMTLKQDEKKVTGTLSGPQGEVPLEGEYAEGKLSFSISVDTQNGTMEIGFAGQMNEDGTLAGIMAGPMGEIPWKGERVKESPPAQ